MTWTFALYIVSKDPSKKPELISGHCPGKDVETAQKWVEGYANAYGRSQQLGLFRAEIRVDELPAEAMQTYLSQTEESKEVPK